MLGFWKFCSSGSIYLLGEQIKNMIELNNTFSSEEGNCDFKRVYTKWYSKQYDGCTCFGWPDDIIRLRPMIINYWTHNPIKQN